MYIYDTKNVNIIFLKKTCVTEKWKKLNKNMEKYEKQ